MPEGRKDRDSYLTRIASDCRVLVQKASQVSDHALSNPIQLLSVPNSRRWDM